MQDEPPEQVHQPQSVVDTSRGADWKGGRTVWISHIEGMERVWKVASYGMERVWTGCHVFC